MAVVVGILVIYGALISYEARKQSAGDSVARERVTAAMSTVAQYMATTGSPPTSGTMVFANTWANLHPDEKQQSPWGGPTGDPTLGVSEDPAIAAGNRNQAQAPDITASVPVNPARAGNLYYLSTQDGLAYVTVTPPTTPLATAVKGYVLSIYDQQGNPWLCVVGGK